MIEFSLQSEISQRNTSQAFADEPSPVGLKKHQSMPDSKSSVLNRNFPRLRTRNLHSVRCESGPLSSKKLNLRIEIYTEDWRSLFPETNSPANWHWLADKKVIRPCVEQSE